MRSFALIGCCAMLAAGLLPTRHALAAEPTGEWLVENGAAQIRIENCGGSLWGIISWQKTPGGVDTHNPDPALRTRPLLGMPTLLGLKRARNERWEGQVYNAENGKTYDVNIKLTNPDTLRIEGCVLGFLCGGQNWTRVAQQQPVAPASPPQTRGGPPTPSRSMNAQLGATPQPAAKGPAAAEPAAVSDVCSRVSDLARRPH
jgi:uncharacterized protein (DUF2147 family)